MQQATRLLVRNGTSSARREASEIKVSARWMNLGVSSARGFSSVALRTNTRTPHPPIASSSRHTQSPSVGGPFVRQSRSIFIQTESTPNEDSLKFIPGQAVMPQGGTYEFMNPSSTLASPLAMSLFNVPGVKSIFYGPDFVTVSKHPEESWSTMKPEIFSILMEHFSAGKGVWKDPQAAESAMEPEDTKIRDDDSETVAMIKELLATRVRPAIQEDGGDIEFLGFEEDPSAAGTGIVQLTLKGSCRGCSSSTVTLKNGIERMLMHYVPEVKGVEQVLGPEEQVAVDEFAKFEQRLRSEGKTVEV